jgi:hypothetical protein
MLGKGTREGELSLEGEINPRRCQHEIRGTRLPPPDAFEFRSIDRNKLTQPDLNPAGMEFERVDPANFTDGFV